MKRVNDARKRSVGGPARPDVAAGRVRGRDGARGSRSRHQKKISSTAIAPGTIVSANSVRYCPGYASRNTVASTGPTTAPRLSIALVEAVHLAARRRRRPAPPASRRAARRGRPCRRGRARAPRTPAATPVASAMNGRTADDTPYPSSTSGRFVARPVGQPARTGSSAGCSRLRPRLRRCRATRRRRRGPW